MEIKDSGTRAEFGTGAVRDGASGKGRFDLLPLEALGEVAIFYDSDQTKTMAINDAIDDVDDFIKSGDRLRVAQACANLLFVLHTGDSPLSFGFAELPFDSLQAVALVFEVGAKKYAPRNWEKGIPTYRYVDSALRHLWKHCSSWSDEPHLAMSAWNLLCLLQTEMWIDEGKLPETLR